MKKYSIQLSLFFLLTVLFSGILRSETLDSKEKNILAYIDQHFDQQIKFLETTVNINSGTLNLSGVKKVGQVYSGEFKKLGFATQWIGMPNAMNRAGHLHAHLNGNKGMRLLLIGHLDTVFPHNSAFQTFKQQGQRITGPGVVDMKNGNAIILYALKALQAQGLLKNKQIDIFFTGDEESIGEPLNISRKDLIELAKHCDVAINFEAGRQNQAVIARRGASLWSLETHGKRAHSSGIFRPNTGAGAIYEISRIVNGFYTSLKDESDLTFNTSIIAGGTKADFDNASSTWQVFGKSNVIAQTAKAEGDIRFISPEQESRARKAMQQIVDKNLTHTDAKITFYSKYPSMQITPGNKALLKVFNQTSLDLGYGEVKPNNPGSRGAADVSFVAPHIASIDALGSWGGGSHTPNEWMDLDGFKIATKRAAIYLYRLTKQATLTSTP